MRLRWNEVEECRKAVERNMRFAMSKKALLAWLTVFALPGTGLAQTVDTLISTGLREPHSVVVDTNNFFYITDSGNNRIVRFAPDSGVLTSIAGAAGAAEGLVDGVGPLARFFSPRGIVIARGGLVVADYGNHVIRWVGFSGQSRTLAGIGGVQGKIDGPMATATFNYPIGLATDLEGNIYVADSKNNAIRKIGTNDVVTTLIGSGLYEPAAVTIGDRGDVWVADTRNHTIRGYRSDGTLYPDRTIGSGSRFISGALDALDGRDSLLNNPRGLYWLGSARGGLLVSDSGNHTLRQVIFDPELNYYSVTTFSGVAGQSGLRDAEIRSATFNSPITIAKETLGNTLVVVDSANNAIRRIQISPPQPPVSDPQIGYVTFIVDRISGELVSKLVPVTQITFNNEAILAILSEDGTSTYYTFGETPPNVLDDTVPSPNRFVGLTPKFPYRDGLSPSQIRQEDSLINPVLPDLTIKAIGTAEGRKPSKVSQSRFIFRTGTPVVLGNNAASFTLTNQTVGADMWYTVDGSDPTNDVSANPASIRYDGRILTYLLEETNLVLKLRAFKEGFYPSAVVTNIFSPTNFVANTISFGFEDGEASSDFVGSPGQKFYAPVTLSLLDKQKMYTLQFNLSATTNNPSSPPIDVRPDRRTLAFFSALKKPIPATTMFTTIPPAFYLSSTLITVTNRILVSDADGNQFFTNDVSTNVTTAFTNLMSTNTSLPLLAVGYMERRGVSGAGIGNLFYEPLYDSSQQDLITYSSAKDTIFNSANRKVVVGTFAFDVPGAAVPGDTYRIEIGRPSGTSDGIGAPNSSVYIDAPRKGSLGAGRLNATKVVAVGQRRYVVGDAAPFRWLNAGDFGDTNLLSDDLVQVFESAVYRLNTPPRLSDLFDSMDASNGRATSFTNTLVVTNISTNLTASTVLTNITLTTVQTFRLTNSFLTNITVDLPTATEPTFRVVLTNLLFVTNVVAANSAPREAPPVFQLITNINKIELLTTNDFRTDSTLILPGTTKITFPAAIQIVTTNSVLLTQNLLTNVTVVLTNIESTVVSNTVVSPYLSSDGNDRLIDTVQFGDGQLNVDDIFVTFRRSLDPSLKWYARFWSNGVRQAVEVPNTFRGKPSTPVRRVALATVAPANVEPSTVVFRGEEMMAKAGAEVEVPLWAEVEGGMAARVVMINVNVVPLDASPTLVQQGRFEPAIGLGSPTLNVSRGLGNFAVAWLDGAAQGIQGRALLGKIKFVVPESASDQAAYKIEFEHASASPSGLGLMPQRVLDGMVTLKDRSMSSLNDGIPDNWRLKHFGTLRNLLIQARADADGDGMMNVEEFQAGTNPVDPDSRLSIVSFNARKDSALGDGIVLSWPSVVGQKYVVESAPYLSGVAWTLVATGIPGNGEEVQFADKRGLPGAQFYRVRILAP